MQIVHYHKETGSIAAIEGGLVSRRESSHHPDHLIAEIDDGVTVDPGLHKIDPETRQCLDRTRDEKIALLLPAVESSVRLELSATDDRMRASPVDHPDPVTDAQRVAWRRYRQQLRDLSKHADAAAMIRAWPQRPDGGDAAVHLRTRLAAAEKV